MAYVPPGEEELARRGLAPDGTLLKKKPKAKAKAKPKAESVSSGGTTSEATLTEIPKEE